jgi:hypothetical protein
LFFKNRYGGWVFERYSGIFRLDFVTQIYGSPVRDPRRSVYGDPHHVIQDNSFCFIASCEKVPNIQNRNAENIVDDPPAEFPRFPVPITNATGDRCGSWPLLHVPFGDAPHEFENQSRIHAVRYVDGAQLPAGKDDAFSRSSQTANDLVKLLA